MSDALFDQILRLLADVKASTNSTVGQVETVMSSLDDIAAHVLALEGIVVALLGKYPVNGDEVAAWIQDQTKVVDTTGTGSRKAVDIAQHLIHGKGP
ncbi:MAG: hypothetical protein HQL34_06915 [Alphaproteobacteria bacterium]|nr:hypothetical protein [Alphaproteobacteria bacterium]